MRHEVILTRTSSSSSEVGCGWSRPARRGRRPPKFCPEVAAKARSPLWKLISEGKRSSSRGFPPWPIGESHAFSNEKDASGFPRSPRRAPAIPSASSSPSGAHATLSGALARGRDDLYQRVESTDRTGPCFRHIDTPAIRNTGDIGFVPVGPRCDERDG